MLYVSWLVLGMSLLSSMGDGVDERLLEVLRDAQTTHRDAWARGRARLVVEISKPKTITPAKIEGEIVWRDPAFVLKCKVSDPDAVFFRDRGIGMDREWNFIAKGKDFVVRYFARTNTLSEQGSLVGALQPTYELSPFKVFASCCPPNNSHGRPWSELVGPSPNMPESSKSSKFAYRRLENGDIEQSRKDESGDRNTILFSAKEDLAVASLVGYHSSGELRRRLSYRYTRRPDGKIVAATCDVDFSAGGGSVTHYKYTFFDLILGGAVPESEFARDAVVARIKRETDYGRNPKRQAGHEADDAQLESAAKALREKGTAKP